MNAHGCAVFMRLRPLMALCVLVVAAPTAARSDDGRTRGWVITRNGTASAPIEGTLTGSSLSEETAVFLFALTGRGRSRAIDFRFVTTSNLWGVDGWAQARAGGVDAPPCPADCSTPVGIARTVYITSNERAIASTVYVVAHDVRDPKVSLSSPGWTVKPWQPTVRLMTATGGGREAAVSVAHESAGTYGGGELVGGAYGSIAHAALPCSNWGVGTGALTGGRRRYDLDCDGEWFALDGWPRSTRWRLDADVVGSGLSAILLFVIDYPRG